MSQLRTTLLGYPRIGRKRELKKALEAYWKGEITLEALEETSALLRKTHWQAQAEAGIETLPSNDFSWYDQTLDLAFGFGAIPSRYAPLWDGKEVNPKLYFAMARGAQFDSGGQNIDVQAMEMTKWFDTNYHYIVPEFDPKQPFELKDSKAVREYLEAKFLGYETRPVLLGPVSFLLLGKTTDGSASLSLLDSLLSVYVALIQKLKAVGVQGVQFDEPFLAMDLPEGASDAYEKAYRTIKEALGEKELFLATYFGDLGENAPLALSLPFDVIHLDLSRGSLETCKRLAAKLPSRARLSLGLVDGRNIWRADLSSLLQKAEEVCAILGRERVILSSSCSLLHTPYTLEDETDLEGDLRAWLAFSKEKLSEIVTLSRGLNQGREDIYGKLRESDEAVRSRQTSSRIHNPSVGKRLEQVSPSDSTRRSPYGVRAQAQHNKLKLPLYPTTTIGSFPQTAEVRSWRAQFKKGTLSLEAYEALLREETERVVRFQEEADLDVLVHGEFERNDMVEYFGEQLQGFAFTQNGWVQSYGSRCVKPPLIFGDVSRVSPMTIAWSRYAQSLTSRPMKGMLTGPVTILQWSFVRDDQPRALTCRQIALALRDEVQDLEQAGIGVIQVDEPAIREGLPLRKADQSGYLAWATECFRLAVSCVRDETQIHTHMCYSDFHDIMEAIVALDADVLSIETSRSQMELLEVFATHHYPNEIGPGVYDIHSPRLPSQAEMEALLRAAGRYLRPEQLWVNPDCGLKTRAWAEVRPALLSMVAAAKALRASSKA